MEFEAVAKIVAALESDEPLKTRAPPDAPPIMVVSQPAGPPKFGPPTQAEAQMRDMVCEVVLREVQRTVSDAA